MSSSFHRPSLHKVAFSCLLAVCVLVLFFVYYKPEIKFPTFLCAKEAQAQVSNHSPDQHINSLHNDIQRVQAASEDAELDTLLLIWMWPFGNKFDLNCSIFNIRCHLTDDKSLYHKAHGVIFHHRNIKVASLPKEQRPWFQKWVWFNMESPANSGQIPEINHLFNLTCNYRLDSNIPVPYGQLLPLSSGIEGFELPPKDKLVCWIVSNWNPNFRRVQFYNELKKHVQINTYGRAFNQHVSDQDYTKIMSSCKFYLSFENSIHKDYITEKLFRPLKLGSVPIVLGPPRQNYEDHIPADSFIHVDDFSTPKELAERILYLERNITEYMKYFNWKNRYEVQLAKFGQENACRTCSYLQKNRRYQAFHDLNKWYWG
ncbi:alpha-(1,3)-fucosyltransferase 9-like [Seriola lalandi dorsalis]|uniref:alpha-(1,3)-fucosyltransferase 9-like n=1 Tax=Seriola lalandi dorsalis TaxID=1841481 RepID=UPI000C6FBF4F|nr:alpha-(1,3)-fucosyltransferase 9-like [Seriola lalandi dorsalis]